jgi:hypothetical protein
MGKEVTRYLSPPTDMGEDWFKCVAGLQVDVAFA